MTKKQIDIATVLKEAAQYPPGLRAGHHLEGMQIEITYSNGGVSYFYARSADDIDGLRGLADVAEISVDGVTVYEDASKKRPPTLQKLFDDVLAPMALDNPGAKIFCDDPKISQAVLLQELVKRRSRGGV